MSGLSACLSLGCSLNIYVPKSCLSLLLLSADTARLVCCFPLTMTDCLVFVWSLFPHRLGADADSSWTHLIGRHWKLQPCFLIVYSQQRKTCMQRSPITSKAVSEIPNQGTSHHCNYPTCKTPPWQSMEACDSEEHSMSDSGLQLVLILKIKILSSCSQCCTSQHLPPVPCCSSDRDRSSHSRNWSGSPDCAGNSERMSQLCFLDEESRNKYSLVLLCLHTKKKKKKREILLSTMAIYYSQDTGDFITF